MKRSAALFAALAAIAACPEADPEPPRGDALFHLTRSDTPTFWETTDMAAKGDAAYACTGTKSFTIFGADTPEVLPWLGDRRFGGSHPGFPRCSHIDLQGDRMLVSSHRDEVQRTPWIALLDTSEPQNPQVLDEWETDLSLDEAALDGDRAWIAAHEDGLLRVSIAGDTFELLDTIPGLGNVSRVARRDGGAVAGTQEGDVVFVGPDGAVERTVALGAAVQALLDLGDGRIAVALGSAGFVLLDGSGATLASVDTRGTALRFDRFDDGRLLVANWRDLRIYDVAGDAPVLIAVDAVFQAGQNPRHLAAATAGGIVYAGEWDGVHSLEYRPDVAAPELTPSTRWVKVPADGEEQAAELTLWNEGPLELEVTDVDPPTGWAVSDRAFTLAPGASATLALTFEGSTTPTSRTLRIHSDDADETPAEIALVVGSDKVFAGDPAPDFSYVGVNTGETHTLSEQYGKVVVLSYFGFF